MNRFHKVARVSDVPPGTGRTVEVSGTKIAIFNVAGRFYAIDDRCPHAGGPLGDGILDGCVVTCPYHFWQFDLVKGHAPDLPEARVVRFEVRVEGDEVAVCESPVGEHV